MLMIIWQASLLVHCMQLYNITSGLPDRFLLVPVALGYFSSLRHSEALNPSITLHA